MAAENREAALRGCFADCLRGAADCLRRANAPAGIEVIDRLRAHETELRDLGVEGLYLFGSTARGENSDESDVDLFIDYARGRFGLFDLMDVKLRTSKILGMKADVTSRDSLHDLLPPQMEATAVQVF